MRVKNKKNGKIHNLVRQGEFWIFDCLTTPMKKTESYNEFYEKFIILDSETEITCKDCKKDEEQRKIIGRILR